MTKKKEKEIKIYINSRIKKFKEDVITIAIENEHPYIGEILEKAIIKLKECIKDKSATVKIEERIFL
jgi:hypothetical protein